MFREALAGSLPSAWRHRECDWGANRFVSQFTKARPPALHLNARLR